MRRSYSDRLASATRTDKFSRASGFAETLRIVLGGDQIILKNTDCAYTPSFIATCMKILSIFLIPQMPLKYAFFSNESSPDALVTSIINGSSSAHRFRPKSHRYLSRRGPWVYWWYSKASQCVTFLFLGDRLAVLSFLKLLFSWSWCACFHIFSKIGLQKPFLLSFRAVRTVIYPKFHIFSL